MIKNTNKINYNKLSQFRNIYNFVNYFLYSLIIPVYLSIMKYKYDNNFIDNINYAFIVLLSFMIICCYLNKHKDFMLYGILLYILFGLIVLCYIIFIVNILKNGRIKKENKYHIHYRILLVIMIKPLLIILFEYIFRTSLDNIILKYL